MCPHTGTPKRNPPWEEWVQLTGHLIASGLLSPFSRSESPCGQEVTSDLPVLSSLRRAATSDSHSCCGWLTPGRGKLCQRGRGGTGTVTAVRAATPCSLPSGRALTFFYISPYESSVSEAEQSITLLTQIGLVKSKAKAASDSFLAHKNEVGGPDSLPRSFQLSCLVTLWLQSTM